MNTTAIRSIENTLFWWVRGVNRRPVLALGVVLVLALASAVYGATTLRVNTDASDMIDPSLPYRQAQRAYEAAFPELDDIILVLIRAESGDAADAFTARLAAMLAAHTDVIDTVYSPASHPFFSRNGLLLMGRDDLSKQLDRLTGASSVIENLNRSPFVDTLFASLASRISLAREDASVDRSFLDPVYGELDAVMTRRLEGTPRPLSWQRLFTVDPDPEAVHQRVIAVTPRLDFASLNPAKAAIAAIRADIETVMASGRWDGVTPGITGTPALRSEELKSVSSGIGLSMGLSFLAVSVLLWFALRSFGMVLSAVGTLVLTLCLTAGFAAVTIGALNLVSIAFAVLLIGLGIDFAIHFALHIMETRDDDSSRELSLQRTVREVGGALALCAPTTALAFFAFVPTQFIGMAQLGIISGAGVLIAFAVAITVIPAVAALLPGRIAQAPTNGASRFAVLARGKTGRALALGTILLAVASLPLLTQVRFDADPMHLRDPSSPSVRTFQRLFDDTTTTPYRLNALLPDAGAAEDLATRLEALDVVERVITLQDFVPEDQESKLFLIDDAIPPLLAALRRPEPVAPLAGDPGLARLRQELARDATHGILSADGARLSETLARYAATKQSDPSLQDGLQADLFRFWDFQMARLKDQLSARPFALEDLPEAVRGRFIGRQGQHRLEITPSQALDIQDEADRRRFVETVAGSAPSVTGSALTVLRAGDIVAASMVQAAVLAGVVVFVLLWILVGQVGTVLMILFPVLLAAILTSAAGVLLGQPYNFANVIVIPLVIGLGADSGIHLTLRGQKLDQHNAVFATTTPRAVLFSALTTIASFGTLMLSDHRGTASMGSLLTIAILFTLLCTLLVLPVAMDTLRRRPAT